MLHLHTCYDVQPMSTKLITLDTGLALKKALLVLVQHGQHSAPLWDTRKQCFIGMLTATDFLHLILHYYHKRRELSMDEVLLEMDGYRIRGLYEDRIVPLRPHLVGVSLDAPLVEAARLLVKHRIQTVALFHPTLPGQEGERPQLVSTMSHNHIITFIAMNYIGQVPPDLKLEDVKDKVGTYGSQLITCKPEVLLIDAIDTLTKHHLSALPLVDGEGGLMDVCEKSNVVDLVPGGLFYDLSQPVGVALSERRSPEQMMMHTCQLGSTLRSIIETMGRVVPRLQRLLVVDDTPLSSGRKRLVGIVTTYDLLEYFDCLSMN